MRVTKLAHSRRYPERWYIQLENGDSLRVDLDRIAEFDLFTGRELAEEELAALRQKCQRSRVRERALRILGSRMLSRKELRDRLTEKGEPPEEADAAVDWLESLGVLDDEAYAAAIVRHYAAKGYGPGRLREELYRRGIPEELRRAALEAAPEPEDRLGELAARELARLPEDGEERTAALRRLRDKLLRRGYSREDVARVLSAEQAEE